MYNVDLPTRAELPTSKQLARSTFLAALAASVILVTIVLPSEYAVDPTGTGKMLGLTEMGQIKTQLAKEAETDRLKVEGATQPTEIKPVNQQGSSLLNRIFREFGVGSAMAQTIRTDEISVTIRPGEGAEVKLVMLKGNTANYTWTSNGANVNFDVHGDGGGEKISYEKGRGVTEGQGVLEAAFDGNHGWFWRNRTDADVTVTLKTEGAYMELKRML
ncbi:MAG: transmembrane anchor protein [Allorhizobium sp.]